MSVDTDGSQVETVEAPPPADETRGRSFSLWFLAIPIALAVAAAALAFFLLAPRDKDLMTTPDSHAVAVAVANSKPAPPAIQKTPAAAQR
ncbi:MAG: hypothetical protein ACM3W4_10710 [Ignavibacteriales bacterium]